MHRSATLLICVAITTAVVTPALPQDNPLRQLDTLGWQRAPGSGRIGTVAAIELKGDLQFLDASGTRRFLELNGNPPRDDEYTLAPRDYGWFAVFSFDESGYVKDDETIDPDQLLQSLQRSNKNSIEERRRLGLPVLYLEGWSVPPHYDVRTRRLEWGTRLRRENGSMGVNYSIRLLGRTGVMSAVLVSSPDDLQKDLGDFRGALNGFEFNAGYRYAEFRSGDRVAEYGLAALIVGGAAAAAAKSGAAKGILKILGIGAIAVFVAVAAFFKRLFARGQ